MICKVSEEMKDRETNAGGPEEAQTRLHRVGIGSFFFSRVSHEVFHLLFLNPPYLSALARSQE